ncbi:uncharacterized protein LOC143294165 [Babylonia areolata]|uniref:uncharacterized protein LOC143294165 n=1 Tax=Babylonia areolata TaxID=304850 RepID=UPI003FD0D38D
MKHTIERGGEETSQKLKGSQPRPGAESRCHALASEETGGKLTGGSFPVPDEMWNYSCSTLYSLKRGHRKREQTERTVIFDNLPDDFTEEDLGNAVEQCGVVSSVHIMKKDGRSQGFARMANKDDCEKLIKNFKNLNLPGCITPYLVKFADLTNRRNIQQAERHTEQPQHFGPAAGLAPPQQCLSIRTGHPDNRPHQSSIPPHSVAAVRMAAHGMPQMPVYPMHPVMYTPIVANPLAQYPTIVPLGYNGYIRYAAPAPMVYPQLPPGAQYGVPIRQLQPIAPSTTAGSFFVSTAAGVRQVRPAVQATMNQSVSRISQVRPGMQGHDERHSQEYLTVGRRTPQVAVRQVMVLVATSNYQTFGVAGAHQENSRSSDISSVQQLIR